MALGGLGIIAIFYIGILVVGALVAYWLIRALRQYVVVNQLKEKILKEELKQMKNKTL